MFEKKTFISNLSCTYRPNLKDRCGLKHNDVFRGRKVSLSVVIIMGKDTPTMEFVCNICEPSMRECCNNVESIIPVDKATDLFACYNVDQMSKDASSTDNPDKPRRPRNDKRGHHTNRRDNRQGKPEGDRGKGSNDPNSSIAEGKFPVLAEALADVRVEMPVTKPGEMPANHGMTFRYLVETCGLDQKLFDEARKRSYKSKTPVLDEVAKTDEGRAAIQRMKEERDHKAKFVLSEADPTATEPEPAEGEQNTAVA